VDKLPYVRAENVLALCADAPPMTTASAVLEHLMATEAAPPFMGEPIAPHRS
jgi:hypothetical protein